MPVINVILGRQSGTNLLQISGSNNNVIGTIGQIGSVDNGVSHQHLKMAVDSKNLEVTISNLNPKNQTRVNGTPILTSKVEDTDTIELGMNSYRLNINSVIELLQKEGLLPRVYSIKHLESVWNHYYDTNKQNQIHQGRMNAIMGVTGAFSMLAIIVSMIPTESNILSIIRYVCYAIAFISVIVTCIVRFRGASSNLDQKEELEEYMQKNYICPKKDCSHFLGYQKYKLVLHNGKCPYCGSKFEE